MFGSEESNAVERVRLRRDDTFRRAAQSARSIARTPSVCYGMAGCGSAVMSTHGFSYRGTCVDPFLSKPGALQMPVRKKPISVLSGSTGPRSVDDLCDPMFLAWLRVQVGLPLRPDDQDHDEPRVWPPYKEREAAELYRLAIARKLIRL